MKLTDLHARFVAVVPRDDGIRSHREVGSISEAQGVRFSCPLCVSRSSDGLRGVHDVICWSADRGAPDGLAPGPGRWSLVGTGLNDLTLNGERGKSRSVLLTGGCGWHGFITNGEASIV